MYLCLHTHIHTVYIVSLYTRPIYMHIYILLFIYSTYPLVGCFRFQSSIGRLVTTKPNQNWAGGRGRGQNSWKLRD